MLPWFWVFAQHYFVVWLLGIYVENCYLCFVDGKRILVLEKSLNFEWMGNWGHWLIFLVRSPCMCIYMYICSRCQRCRGRLFPHLAATLLVKGAHSNGLWKLSSMMALPETFQNSLKFHLHILWWELYCTHALMSCACCATRRHNLITIWGALCNEDEVYHLCILWQRMGLWIILIFIYSSLYLIYTH